MKKLLVLTLITLFSLNCYSQITFENGYFITNAGKKTNCLIKNIDWKNNPTGFEYKMSENAQINNKSIKNVTEFGISGHSKYKRFTVNIDRSSEKLSDMSFHRRADFKKETIFLKVLIEGDATLYYYEDENLRRFFFSVGDKKAEQLIFKQYITSGNKILKNERYKQQLLNNLKCKNISLSDIKKTGYNKKDLINLFIKYNKCKDSKFTSFGEKLKRDLFNFTVRPGLNSSSLTIRNSVLNPGGIDFGNKLGFRFGIEAEFIMPYNKNKWAIIIEPTYQYFISEKKLTNENVKAYYKSIELPVGIRYYFFLNKNSKIFINASYIIDFTSNSAIKFDSGKTLEIVTNNNIAFGIGYKKNNKYSLELRYQTSRNILRSHLYWHSNYNTLSIVFGYTIF